MNTKHSYGWIPQPPDSRDHIFQPAKLAAPLPSAIDLRPHFPAAFNQFQLGSCVSNGVSRAVEYSLIHQGLTIFRPSRLFIYYNGRVIEGTVKSDNGLYVRDGIKTVNSLGVCPESTVGTTPATIWPYDIEKFAVKPPAACYADALLYKSLKYEAVGQNLNTMKACINQRLPFVFGFTVYESFESDTVTANGIVPMPGTNEDILGGHCCVAVGYNDTAEVVDGCPPQHFIAFNSWGPEWGASALNPHDRAARGCFYMPFPYLTNPILSSDFWAIQVMQ